MMLVELAEAPEAALPVPALKDHLRLGTGFADDDLQDALLVGFLRAAVAAVEGRTGKALLRRAFALTVREWRSPDRQPLPMAPVASVTAVTLADAQGGAAAAPAGSWRLEVDGTAPALVARGSALPQIAWGGAATIAFQAGFGTGWDAVPRDLGHAALMLAAHYYDNRHDTALGPGCMPFGVTALLERYRPLRLSGGVA